MLKSLLTAILALLIITPAAGAKNSDSVYVITGNTVTHVINRGETLAEIAQIFNVSVDTILKHNPWIEDPHWIPAGGGLKIPVSEAISKKAKLVELPPGILNVPPETVRSVISKTAPEIAKLFPKEMNISGSSMDKIKSAVSQAVPKKMEIADSSIKEIKKAIQDANIQSGNGPLAQIRSEVTSAINDAIPKAFKEQGKNASGIKLDIPWWGWIFLILIVLGAIGIIFLLYKTFSGDKDKKKKEDDRRKVEAKHKSEDNDKDRSEEKQTENSNFTLMPNAGRKEFHKWLDENKKRDPEKPNKCFRCQEKIKNKNMNRHIYERCENKPKWAVQEKDSEELKIKNGKKYRISS